MLLAYQVVKYGPAHGKCGSVLKCLAQAFDLFPVGLNILIDFVSNLRTILLLNVSVTQKRQYSSELLLMQMGRIIGVTPYPSMSYLAWYAVSIIKVTFRY